MTPSKAHARVCELCPEIALHYIHKTDPTVAEIQKAVAVTLELARPVIAKHEVAEQIKDLQKQAAALEKGGTVDVSKSDGDPLEDARQRVRAVVEKRTGVRLDPDKRYVVISKRTGRTAG